jgi:membrane-associated HD superfamily phosphohydrolase
VRDQVLMAGFPANVADSIVARLLHDPQPTVEYDAEETERQAQLAADQIEPVIIEHRAGEVLYRRGEVLAIAVSGGAGRARGVHRPRGLVPNDGCRDSASQD